MTAINKIIHVAVKILHEDIDKIAVLKRCAAGFGRDDATIGDGDGQFVWILPQPTMVAMASRKLAGFLMACAQSGFDR